MPYKSIEAAKEGKFPTTADGIDLTLAQINRLAAIYDAIKASDDNVEDAMAVAWMQWKKLYKIEDDIWITNMDLLPENSEYMEYDVGSLNNTNTNIKVWEISVYRGNLQERIDPEYIRNRLASEIGYEGIGTFSIYSHDPNLKVGDQIPDMVERLCQVSITVTNKTETHDAILQTLNRQIGGYCFPVDAFTNSVESWSDIPLIYANDHPDMVLFDKNPDAALKKINGEIVGAINNPYIATDGHPRLMGQLKNTNEAVSELITNGKASISTGFMGSANKDKQIISVIPNHVLIFKEDAGNMPKDHGAFILNKSDYIEFTNAGELIHSPEISHAGTGKPIHSHKIDPTKEVENMEEIDKLSEKLEIANKELGNVTSQMDVVNKENETLKTTIEDKDKTLEDRDASIEVANKEVESLKTMITEYEATINEFKQKEADTLAATRNDQWETVVKNLPVGLTHKEEDAKALRVEWDSDPYKFTAKYLPMAQKIPGTGESGAEFNQKDGKPATVGTWDPYTKEWTK